MSAAGTCNAGTHRSVGAWYAPGRYSAWVGTGRLRGDAPLPIARCTCFVMRS